jgi:polar amino acid transport system permease protein
VSRRRLARRPIPGVDAAASTDLPVLLPAAERLSQKARSERSEGTWRLDLRLWHGGMLLIVFLLVAGFAEAQSGADPDKGVFATRVRWIPVIMWIDGNRFVLNLVISFPKRGSGLVSCADSR